MSKHPKTSTELKRKSRAPSIRDSTGAAGIALIHQLAIASGFIFREPTGIDLGIDTQIEVFSEKKSRGYVLIQSKCTIGPRTSWKRVPVTNASVLLEYWRSMRSPVILIQSQLAKHEGDHRVFQATRLRAIDISEESIEYTKDAILWDPEKAKSANTVLQWTTIESVLDFKNFLLNVSSRQEIAARHNAIWLSDSALDSSDFDAAAHAIDVYEKTYAAVSSVNIAIQRCRILRRRGAWHPKNTKISLEHYLPTKIAPPLTEKLTKEQCQVLQEIGYSFVVGALKEWAMDHTTKIGREYLSEGLRYLAWWKESKETKDDCETFDYMLYGQQIEYVMNRGSVDAMNETAEELTRAVTRNASGAAEASLSLWRQALILCKEERAAYWMGELWPIFGLRENEVPKIWKRKRVPQNFAGAMLLRSWTFALLTKESAREVFETAKIAINGVISYPEIEYWMCVATDLYPHLDADET